MKLITNGTRVQLHSPVYGTTMTGKLHLPDEEYLVHGKNGAKTVKEAKTVRNNSYGVHTIILDDGIRFRNHSFIKAVED